MIERTRAVDTVARVNIMFDRFADRSKTFDTDYAEIQMQQMAFADACE